MRVKLFQSDEFLSHFHHGYILLNVFFFPRRENTRAVFLTLTRLFGKCMQVRSQAYRLPLVPGIILGPFRASPQRNINWLGYDSGEMKERNKICNVFPRPAHRFQLKNKRFVQMNLLKFIENDIYSKNFQNYILPFLSFTFQFLKGLFLEHTLLFSSYPLHHLISHPSSTPRNLQNSATALTLSTTPLNPTLPPDTQERNFARNPTHYKQSHRL